MWWELWQGCASHWRSMEIASTHVAYQFSLLDQSYLTLCDPMDCSMPAFPVLHHSPEACSNSCPSCQWCHPAVSSSVAPFFCPQFPPASGSFPVSHLFTSGGQIIGASVSASVLPMNIQDWLVWSPCSPGTLKSLFQYHSSKAWILWHSAFFIVQLSHLYMILQKPELWLEEPLLAK